MCLLTYAMNEHSGTRKSIQTLFIIPGHSTQTLVSDSAPVVYTVQTGYPIRLILLRNSEILSCSYLDASILIMKEDAHTQGLTPRKVFGNF